MTKYRIKCIRSGIRTAVAMAEFDPFNSRLAQPDPQRTAPLEDFAPALQKAYDITNLTSGDLVEIYNMGMDSINLNNLIISLMPLYTNEAHAAARVVASVQKYETPV